jgi:hypothetical protein
VCPRSRTTVPARLAAARHTPQVGLLSYRNPLQAGPRRARPGVEYGKSRRRRAYPQQIVTTRLLYCLQDPFAHLSRLQRIRSRACQNYNTLAPAPELPGGRGYQPSRIRGQGLFSSAYSVREVSPRSGMDSDLEAFSHYPADGSVAALPGRTTAETNYLNQRFLSY